MTFWQHRGGTPFGPKKQNGFVLGRFDILVPQTNWADLSGPEIYVLSLSADPGNTNTTNYTKTQKLGSPGLPRGWGGAQGARHPGNDRLLIQQIHFVKVFYVF